MAIAPTTTAPTCSSRLITANRGRALNRTYPRVTRARNSEHPRNQNLLFWTEFGAYVSFDRGGRWTRLKGNLPLVRVDDIQIHRVTNALVLARTDVDWVLDDLSPLERARKIF